MQRTTDRVRRSNAERFFLHDHEPAVESFREAVLQGLSRPQKAIPCRFLYDERGSRLFDLICEQPEYYPTRTEMRILERNACEMARLIGPDAQLIELGSGSSRKTGLLLKAMDAPATYLPIDISLRHLDAAARRVAGQHANLEVHAICADYCRPFPLPDTAARGASVAFFPGSTIGNFEPAEALEFLSEWSGRLGVGGHMIIGVDLRKPAEVLHRAYDDAAGVTEAFSRNLLMRANRELHAGFDPLAFSHEARYNPDRGCVEIHLVSHKAIDVAVADRVFPFLAGERLHVENSYKYTVDRFKELAREAGFDPRACWTDPQQLFSVHFLTARAHRDD